MTSMPPDIKPIREADLPALAALYRRVFNAAPWHDGWTDDAAHERLAGFLRHPEFAGFAAWREDEALGLVMGWRERWIHAWTFHLNEMCVAPECQRQGLGSALLAALRVELRDRGVSGMWLQTGADTPARRFYEHEGFRTNDLVSLTCQV